MIEITHKQFEHQLQQLQDDKEQGLSGPFIHPAPKGNMHSDPFRKYAWTIKGKLALQKS